MPPYRDASASFFRRPGKVVTVAMCATTALTLMFAIGLHWAGLPAYVFELVPGSTLHVLRGEVWRLFTWAVVQSPSHPFDLLWILLGLYFFGIPLESEWGSARFARFLLYLVLVPAVFQVLFELAVPVSVSRVLIPEYWSGGSAVITGLVMAWALSNSAGTILLFGFIPLTPRVMIWITAGGPLLYLIFRSIPGQGFPATYGAIGTGWLLSGTPTRLRRYWLKYRMRRLTAEVTREGAREAAQRKRRVEQSRLKVIEGGRAKGESPGEGEKGRGPDGRWLN